MSNKPVETPSTKVITDPKFPVRFSYVHVFEPESINDSNDEKYSVAILIPKKDKGTIARINAAIQAATEKGKTSKWGGKIPKSLENPLHDGDVEREEDETYAGYYYLNAKSAKTKKPGVVDKYRQPITDPEQFYSGCYGVASFSFYPYDAAGNRGIGCGLNNVMKTAEGEPLGGRVSAETDFAEVEVEDDVDPFQ